MTVTPETTLTDDDLRLITKARELAAVRPGADLMALAEALGMAQDALDKLADLAKRLACER